MESVSGTLVEDIPDSWYKKSGSDEYKRIDDYWKQVMDMKNGLGLHKFKVLPKFVKAVLCLAHGNADVEHTLSENKKVVTNERTLLSNESINGLRLAKDAVNVIGSGEVHSIPITPGLLRARKFVHRSYSARSNLEKEERAKKKKVEVEKAREEEEKKGSLADQKTQSRSRRNEFCHSTIGSPTRFACC